MNPASKADWDAVWEEAKVGNLTAIPANIRVQHYSKLKAIAKDHMVITEAEGLRGEWIYGPSGVGKSRRARDLYPGAYPKLCNKWWDGYQCQSAVIMDDIGIEHKMLG